MELVGVIHSEAVKFDRRKGSPRSGSLGQGPDNAEIMSLSQQRQ